ncbi:hypothetical protein [Streptomyces sp. NPDC000410]
MRLTARACQGSPRPVDKASEIGDGIADGAKELRSAFNPFD